MAGSFIFLIISLIFRAKTLITDVEIVEMNNFD